MSTQVLIPILGEAIVDAQLVTWFKEPGQIVQRGDELAELETDKATLTVECPANGVLLSVLTSPGARVFPGQVIAIVGQPGEEVPALSSTELTKPEHDLRSISDPIENQIGEREKRVSPAARKLAREAGIDLSMVTPTDPGARITSEDVQRYLDQINRENPPMSLPAYHRLELTTIRRALANKMMESASQIPQFSVSIDVNADHLLAYKARLKELGQDISLTSIFICVIPQVIQRHPMINSRYDIGSILIFETVNIAVAVATPQGLVAPIIYTVENLDINEISNQLDHIIKSARENHLRLDQLTNATFTISNLGMYGVNQFIPLVNPPQAAILGIGGIRKTILATGQILDGASLMSLTVSADHRILDGVYVAQFLADLREVLEKL